MKISYCLIIICFVFHFSGYAGEKRALVVAISEYPKHSDWNPIHADNDLKILIPALEKQGFMKKNIMILQNEQATKNDIVNAFNLLSEKSGQNDSVFIHFSCHGQQMEDDNGDEPDGLDESLIPYDAKMFFKAGIYEGENHLRDDEVDTYLLPVRKKLGNKGNLIVSLDACHSQSGSRGDDEEEECIRGTAVIFSRSPDFKGKGAGDMEDVPLIQRDGLSPITVISACKSNQNNYEYKIDNEYYGSLTYAICWVWNQQAVLPDYKQWSSALEKKMKEIAPRQSLVLETTLIQ
jgi:hypothetical protein